MVKKTWKVSKSPGFWDFYDKNVLTNDTYLNVQSILYPWWCVGSHWEQSVGGNQSWFLQCLLILLMSWGFGGLGKVSTTTTLLPLYKYLLPFSMTFSLKPSVHFDTEFEPTFMVSYMTYMYYDSYDCFVLKLHIALSVCCINFIFI